MNAPYNQAVNDCPHRIREYRLKQNISQERLGALIGTSRVNIHKYETNKVPVTLHTLLDIAKALQIPPEYLLTDFVLPQGVKKHILDWIKKAPSHQVDGVMALITGYATLAEKNGD